MKSLTVQPSAGRNQGFKGEPKKEVVVVGGGLAGVAAAIELAHSGSSFHTTLVNPDRSMVMVPELPDYVARGTGVEVSLEALSKKHGFDLVEAKAQSYDDGKVVLADGRELSFDAVILAVGGQSRQALGRAQIPDGVFGLRNLTEASRLKAAIEQAIAARAKGAPPVSLGIVGAGMSGIELAAAVAESHRGEVHVSLYGRLSLPDERAVSYAREHLRQLGVSLHEDVRVRSMAADSVTFGIGSDGPSVSEANQLVVAVAGDEGAGGPLSATDRENAAKRLEVDATLQMTDRPNVFVAGDAASVKNAGTGADVPQTAAMAELGGRHAARNVRHLLEKDQPLEAFKKDLKVWVASLGERDAVGSVFGLRIKGRVAAMAKNLIEAMARHPSRLGYEVVDLAASF